MLTAAEARIAKSLYRRWFSKNPGAKNPSDVNTKDKYGFFFELGWESLELCQRARKSHTANNEWPYPWTRWQWWKERPEELL